MPTIGPVELLLLVTMALFGALLLVAMIRNVARPEALLAEFTQKRLAGDGRRSASMLPRTLTDYVSRYVLLALRAVAALGVVYFALYAYMPRQEPGSAPHS